MSRFLIKFEPETVETILTDKHVALGAKVTKYKIKGGKNQL